VRSGIWGSVGSLLGVSSGGGTQSTPSMGRSVVDSWSMVFQVNLPKANYDTSGRSWTAGCRIPIGNSPSFSNVE